MTNNDEMNLSREAFEKWRLSKNGVVVYEWEGRIKPNNLSWGCDSCFRYEDYDEAKFGPVEWGCSGSWRFEEIKHG